MTEQEKKLLRQIRAEVKPGTPVFRAIAEVSRTGEWYDGQFPCALGEAVIRQGGSFKLGANGKYIPADLKTIELCESIITDHPGLKFDDYGWFASKLKTKAERIAEAQLEESLKELQIMLAKVDQEESDE